MIELKLMLIYSKKEMKELCKKQLRKTGQIFINFEP